MPTYTYQCVECDLVFDRFHSMSESVEECEKCKSAVKRLLPNSLNLKKSRNFGQKKPGGVVKQYIKDVKEEVRLEKQKIRTHEYEEK
tara:strand:- start:798 stop:1058 length:261 start_codon:yes stop_codon:yes gene_type:complete